MDLTRFDFHVVRFMNSETVKRMSAEEIGQFILLLCDAWLTGKDASLPDDLTYLARVARVNEVSSLVLSKFPIIRTDCGKRRQNPALFVEWTAATKRSRAAREKATSKWSPSSEDYAPKDYEGDVRNKKLRSERLAAARLKGTHTLGEWVALLEFCNGLCVKCGSDDSVVKDHIQPVYQGGSDGIENIQPLCRKCNSGKGSDRTDFRPQNWCTKMPAVAGVKGVLPQPEKAYPNQPISNQFKPIHSKSNQSTPKEVIQKIYAADDAEIAEDTRQHLEKLAEEARVAKLSEGQLF